MHHHELCSWVLVDPRHSDDKGVRIWSVLLVGAVVGDIIFGSVDVVTYRATTVEFHRHQLPAVFTTSDGYMILSTFVATTRTESF
jgi:hypothetical protein